MHHKQASFAGLLQLQELRIGTLLWNLDVKVSARTHVAENVPDKLERLSNMLENMCNLDVGVRPEVSFICDLGDALSLLDGE